MEVIKTNVIGAQNVVDVSLEKKIENVVALSTDKASSPINLYGASKLCSDKIFLSANNIKGSRKSKFSIVRYGNVLGSRGSVLPLFIKLNKSKKSLTLTDNKMTRFNITLEEGVKFVEWCLTNNLGGEIFVPKLKSFRIVDLGKAINSKVKFKLIGIRAGEKIHEELVSQTDSICTIEGKNFYIILNNFTKNQIKNYKKKKRLKSVKENFKYSSDLNRDFLNVTELRNILSKNNFI